MKSLNYIALTFSLIAMGFKYESNASRDLVKTNTDQCVVIIEDTLMAKCNKETCNCIPLQNPSSANSNKLLDIIHSVVNTSECSILMDQSNINTKNINIIIEIFAEIRVVKKNKDLLQSSKTLNCQTERNELLKKGLQYLTKLIKTDYYFIVAEQGTCGKHLADRLARDIPSQHLQVEIKTLTINITEPNIFIKQLQEIKGIYKDITLIMLIDPIITTQILTVSKQMLLVNEYDILIVKHWKYEETLLPPRTLSFKSFKISEFYPMNGERLKQNTSVICELSHCNNKSLILTKFQQRHNSRQFMEINAIVNDEWNLLYTVNKTKDLDVIFDSPKLKPMLSYIISHTKEETIRVVSIMEGPFLFESKKLMLDKQICDKNSMVCSIHIKDDNITMWKRSCCIGYTVDFISFLKMKLNIEMTLYIVEDGNYGGYVKQNKAYNGMIGDVVTHKADIAIAGLTITQHRALYVDFTAPFLQSQFGIITLTDLMDYNYLNFEFIKHLSSEITFAILATYVLALVLIYLTNKVVNYFKIKCHNPIRKLKDFTFIECFSFTVGLMFQHGVGEHCPTTVSANFLSQVFAMVMLIIATLYTAHLTAYQVITNVKTMFEGLKDPRMMYPTENFKFTTLKDSSTESFFRYAQSESLNRMYHFMKKYPIYTSRDGIKAVANRELQAYITESVFGNYQIVQISNDCKLKMHANTLGERSYGIAVKKNSTLKDTLSQAILELNDEQVLNTLQIKWLSMACSDTLPIHKQISLIIFTMPLLLLASFIVIAIIFCFVEILIQRRNIVKTKKTKTGPENMIQ